MSLLLPSVARSLARAPNVPLLALSSVRRRRSSPTFFCLFLSKARSPCPLLPPPSTSSPCAHARPAFVTSPPQGLYARWFLQPQKVNSVSGLPKRMSQSNGPRQRRRAPSFERANREQRSQRGAAIETGGVASKSLKAAHGVSLPACIQCIVKAS